MTILNFNWHFFSDRTSLCRGGWPATWVDVPVSKFQVLGAQAPATITGHYFTALSCTGAHHWKPFFSWEVQCAFSSPPGAVCSQFRARTESKAYLRRVNWFQKYAFEAQVVLSTVSFYMYYGEQCLLGADLTLWTWCLKIIISMQVIFPL